MDNFMKGFKFDSKDPKTTAPADKKDEKADAPKDAALPAKLDFSGSTKTKEEKGKRGLKFDLNGAKNPFEFSSGKSGSSSSKTAMSGFTGMGASGISVYAPSGSKIAEFLNGKMAKGTAEPALAKPPEKPPRMAAAERQIQVKEVAMRGVHFDRIFVMPVELTEDEKGTGPRFQRRIQRTEE